MDIYFYFPVLIIVFHFISLLVPKAVRKILFIIISIVFFLVAGFREVGFDYDNYDYLYDIYSGKDWYAQSLIYSTEIGYAFVNHISPNFQFLIATITFVIIIAQFRFIYNNTKYPFLALFFYFGMFFYSSLMGQYRQAFSLGLMLIAINNLENKKKFLFYILIAFTFHYTAIISLIILWLPKNILKLKVYIIAFIASILLALIFPLLFSSISSLSSYLAAKSSFYEQADYEEITGINSVMIIRAALFSLCFYFRKELEKIPNMGLYMNIYFMSLISYIAFSYMTALASRGSLYFAFFEFILAANLIYTLRKKLMMYFVLLLLFVSLSTLRQMNTFEEENFDECFLPYKNWLIKKI